MRRSLLNSEEIQQILEESDSDSDAASDIEASNEIERELSTNASESSGADEASTISLGKLIAKDGTSWDTSPMPSTQPRARNTIRQRGGPHPSIKIISNHFKSGNMRHHFTGNNETEL